MLDSKFSPPSHAWLFAASVCLAGIVLAAGLLSASAIGLGAALHPITIWWVHSAAWLAFVVSYSQMSPTQRSKANRYAAGALIAALLLTCLPFGLYSDDMLRYQWDGWLSIHGVDPYTFVPLDPSLRQHAFALGGLRLPNQLPYASMHTIYPPGAQLIFAIASAASGGEQQLWKFAFWLMGIIGAIAVWLLSEKHARSWLIIAALSPIVLLHGFADAHLDLIMALFMVMAISLRHSNRPVMSGIMLGAAISMKYLPVLALPVLLTGLSRREVMQLVAATAATLIVMFAPFFGADTFRSLQTFTTTWQTNSAVYSVLQGLVDERLIRPILLAILLGVGFAILRRWHARPIVCLALILMSIAALSPVVHPWYLIAPLALLPWAPLRSVIVWTASMSVYGIGLKHYKGSGVWLDHPAALAVEFLPVLIALAIDYRRGPLPFLHEE